MTSPDQPTGRHRADSAILAALATGATLADVAEAAHVSVSTVQRRLRDPGFRRALDVAVVEGQAATLAALAGQGLAAVSALSTVLSDPEAPPAARVSAARAVLDLTHRRRPDEPVGELVDHAVTRERLEAIHARIRAVRPGGLGDVGAPCADHDEVLGAG